MCVRYLYTSSLLQLQQTLGRCGWLRAVLDKCEGIRYNNSVEGERGEGHKESGRPGETTGTRTPKWAAEAESGEAREGKPTPALAPDKETASLMGKCDQN